jgi:hypothetical protein
MCQPVENKAPNRFACSVLKNGHATPVLASYTLLDLSDEIIQSVVVKGGVMSKLD